MIFVTIFKCTFTQCITNCSAQAKHDEQFGVIHVTAYRTWICSLIEIGLLGGQRPTVSTHVAFATDVRHFLLYINKHCSLVFFSPCLYRTTYLSNTDFLAVFAVDFVCCGGGSLFVWPIFHSNIYRILNDQL